MLSEKEKMLLGDEYDANDLELVCDRARAKEICYEFNNLKPSESQAANRLLKSLFKKSANVHIEPPFYCDYGYNIKVGENFYANHGVVILDTVEVSFGDDVLLAPGVLISAATHPLDPEKRKSGLELSGRINIGNNVWIGMGAKILPNVNIGDNAVVAAGAVVNKDVPANTVVAGVPAAVIRNISEESENCE